MFINKQSHTVVVVVCLNKHIVTAYDSIFSIITALFLCAGEAKNLPPYPGPNRMRDCYCTVNLDQEEVFRTKIIEKSLWCVQGPSALFVVVNLSVCMYTERCNRECEV